MLVLRECCTPCTIDVWRWWPYETDGLRSISMLCLRRGCEAGVVARGVAFCGLDALSARPRFAEWSRRTVLVGGKGAVGGAISRGSGGGLLLRSA